MKSWTISETGLNIHPVETLNSLTKETRAAKGTKRTSTKFLKLWPYKTTVVNALQSHDPTARLHIRNWYLQPVHKSELDSKLTFSQQKV
jgi:hypothetical protein